MNDGSFATALSAESGRIRRGEIVKVSANNRVLLATDVDDAIGGVCISGNVGVGAPVNFTLVGTAPALLVSGLTPVAGDLLYPSSTPGRATTTPGPPPIGLIKDVGTYATDGYVQALIAIGRGGGSTAFALTAVFTVDELRALSGGFLQPNAIYTLLGYWAPYDTSAGQLLFDASSTEADDGIFTFRPDSIGPGDPGRFVRLESGIFDARKGGVKIDGTVNQYPVLATVHAACTERGGFSAVTLVGPGILDVGGGGAPLVPALGNQRAVGLLGVGGVTMRGRDHTQFTTPIGMSSVLDESLGTHYGVHDFTMDLSAALPGGGVRTFTGVATSGLSEGDWVYVRLGADPSDQDLWWAQMVTQIVSIVGSSVTVSDPVPENVPLVSNANRTGNHHDMIRITRVARGFEVGGLTFDNVGLSNSVMVGAYNHDLHYLWTAAAFNHVYDFNTTVERITADKSTGIVFEDHLHYGWFYNGWLHYRTGISQVTIDYLDGVNFINSEGQSRGITVDGARIIVDGSTAENGMFVSSSAAAAVRFNDLVIGGEGEIYSDGLATYENLTVLGAVDTTHTVSFQVNTRQLFGTVTLNNKVYRWIKAGPPMVQPLAPSTLHVLPMPIEGLVRNIRIFTSTLTGVTACVQTSGVRNSDILPDLIAGQYATPNVSALASFLYPGGGWDDTNVQITVTTDGSVPAGAYMQIETEFFVSDASLATTPPLQVVGAGPPSANAAFVGQRYLDRTASAFYTSISSGNGASDWATG